MASDNSRLFFDSYGESKIRVKPQLRGCLDFPVVEIQSPVQRETVPHQRGEFK